MKKNAKIFIVGHNDVIERSLSRYLTANGYNQVISSSSIGLNPTIQASVYEYFVRHKPEYVFLGSVRSGGIEANQKFPADFIYENLEAQNNVLYAAQKFGVKKLLYLASSCIYPKECPQPMPESYFFAGKMEPTSLPYSTAKSAGVVLCQSFRAQYRLNTIVMVPPTVYGPGADTDLQTAHVLGALIAKFTQAVFKKQKKVSLWGTGQPRREFLYADDFAEACVFLMDKYNAPDIINGGAGEDIAITDLAQLIARITGYQGEIVFDRSKPDGAVQKLLDSQRINRLGWNRKVGLEEGVQKTYAWYREQVRKKDSA
jgi:GDP-L-fucose synthase